MAHINLTGKEKTAYEDDSGGVDRPYRLTLIDWRDVIHLYSYIASRTLSLEYCYCGVFKSAKCVLLIRINAHEDFLNLRQGGDTRLESLLIATQLVKEISCKGHVPESGYKDCLRLCHMVSRYSIRQLVY